MGANACLTGDFRYFDAPNYQGIGNERTMTAPWNGLSAHDCSPALPCQPKKGIQRVLEVRSLHVIRVTAEAGVAPSGIDGVAAGMTESAQLR